MGYLGFRAPASLENAVKKMADATGRTKSDIVREAIENFVVDYFTTDDVNWKPMAWNFLNIDSHKLNYALTRSECVEDFFSLVSKWVNRFQIKIIPNEKEVIIQISTLEDSFTSKCPKIYPKEKMIRTIIEDLETQYVDSLVEDI